MTATNAARPRLLVLHGWGNCITPMDIPMQEFKRLPGTLLFPEAPMPVEESDFLDFLKRLRTPEEVIPHVLKLPHYRWWDTQDVDNSGVKRFMGFEEISLPYLQDYVTRNGPIDGIVGFSQGAALATLLTLLAERHGMTMFAVKFVVTVGGFQCRSERHMEELKAPLRTPCLALHGTEDKVVTLERGRSIQADYANCTLITYPGAHHYPRDKSTQMEVAQWIEGQLK